VKFSIKNISGSAGTLLVILILIGIALAAEPIIDIPEHVFDFGFVSRNVEVTHPFIIKNTGGDSLHILEVKPGCSCTQAPLEKANLAAGDTTYTEIIFKTGRYTGKVIKNTSIKAAAQPLQRIQIKAYVLPNARLARPLVIRPMEVDLDDHRPDDPSQPWTVRIAARNYGDEPVGIRLVAGSGELFDISVPHESIPPDSTAYLELKLDERIVHRELKKSFTIALDDSAATRYTVAVKKSAKW